MLHCQLNLHLAILPEKSEYVYYKKNTRRNVQ